MVKKVSKKLRSKKVLYVTRKNFKNLMKKHPDQVVRAYKYVSANWRGPYNPTVTYKPGDTVYVTRWDSNPMVDCSNGLSVATEKWCRDDSCNSPVRGNPRKRGQDRLLLVEFKVSDIVCIPTYSDLKLRVKEFYVVKELKW
jgi:hypothetical protein